MSNSTGWWLLAVFGAAALGWSAQDIHDRLTNPLRNPANWCKSIGTMPPRTFTSHGATLVIPELTGYQCDNGTIHWRADK